MLCVQVIVLCVQVIVLCAHAVCNATVVELSQPVMVFSCAVCGVENVRICHTSCCVYR